MKLKGYRTILFNALAGVIPAATALVAFMAMPEVAALVPGEWAAAYALFLAVANMGLRKITTTPVGQAR